MGDSSESNLNVNLCQLDLYLEVFFEIKKDRKKISGLLRASVEVYPVTSLLMFTEVVH